MNKYELSEAYIGGPTGEIHPGGKMRIGKSGGGGGTSSTKSEIPPELKPLAADYTARSINLANQPWQAYQGDRYADLNQTQNLGIGMIQDRALGGSQTVGNAENQLNNIIGLGASNPYLDQMFNTAAQRVTDAYGRGTAAQTDAAFARSRNYGGSAYDETVRANQQSLGDSLAGMAANIYGGAYDADRSRQMQAIGMAPQFGNMAYQDASQLLNAGSLQQDQAQNNLDFGYQQFQEFQNKPYKDLATMAGVFQTQPFGQSSTTTQRSSGK